jgi:hypothetical protein
MDSEDEDSTTMNAEARVLIDIDDFTRSPVV